MRSLSATIIFVFILFSSANLYSQICGWDNNTTVRLTLYADLVGFLDNTILDSAGYDPGDPVHTIRIALHIVTDNNGNGGVSPAKLSQDTLMLQNALNQANIRFTLFFQDTIQNSDYLSAEVAEQEAMSAAYNVPKTVNIYYTQTLTEGNNQAWGIATFSPDKMSWRNQFNSCQDRFGQYVFIDSDESLSSTLSHEIGHYFDLFHTYETGLGNTSPSTFFNGDLIPETPVANGSAYDCNGSGGTLLLAENLMSATSATNDCRFRFTFNQRRTMRYVLLNRRAELLETPPLRFTNEINGKNAGGNLTVTQNSAVETIPSGNFLDLQQSQNATVETLNERFENWQSSGIDYKHHHWNNLLEIFHLTENFQIQLENDAKFLDLNPVTIQNHFITENRFDQNIDFHDPWYVDENDNQPDAFLPFASPHQPTGSHNESSGGVFLDQRFDIPGNPHYSVRAPENIGSIDYFLLNWSGTNATFQNSFAQETAVVFNAAGATVTANLKGHLASNKDRATGYNKGRRLAMNSAGHQFLAYEDNGEIWFSYSTDGGSAWQNEERVSDVLDSNYHIQYLNPSIAVTNFNTVHIVYEAIANFTMSRQTVQIREVWHRKWTNGVWSNPYKVSEIDDEGTLEARPVVAGTDLGDYLLRVAWRSQPYGTSQVKTFIRANHFKAGSPNINTWGDANEIPTAAGFPEMGVTQTALNNFNTKIIWENGGAFKFVAGKITLTNLNNWLWSSVKTLQSGLPPLPVTKSQPSLAMFGNTAHVAWTGDVQMLGEGIYYDTYDFYNNSNTPLQSTAVVHTGSASIQNASIGMIDFATEAPVIYYENAGKVYKAKKSGSNWQLSNLSNGRYPGAATIGGGGVWRINTSAPHQLDFHTASLAKQANGVATAEVLRPAKRFLYPFGTDSSGHFSSHLSLEIDEIHANGEAFRLDEDLQTGIITPASRLRLNIPIRVLAASLPKFLPASQTLLNIYLTREKERILIDRLSLKDFQNARSGDLLPLSQVMDMPFSPAGTLCLELGFADQKPVIATILKQAGSAAAIENDDQEKTASVILPEDFHLAQNYPNPFNPATTIRLSLPATHYAADHSVRLEIYDINGRKVRTLLNETLPAGAHKVTWQGRNDAGNPVSSGVYIYRVVTGAFSQSRKMMLMR